MAKRGGRDLAVGALFSLALVVVAVTIMAVGGESRLFSKKARYSVVFPSAEGLVVGSPVKMSGVVVGSVQAIRLSTDPGTTGIEVEVGIDHAFSGRVRRDSRAALRILQLLSGEKFVEIIPGSPEKDPLPERSVLDTQQEQALLEQAGIAAENLNEITISLKNILDKLERGEGLIGQMITDPEFGMEGLDALRGSLQNLEVITGDLRQGRGVVGRLLRDEEFAQKTETLFAAVDKVADLIGSVDLEKGALGAVLVEGGAGQRAIEDYAATAASLRRIAENLESEDGMLGQLIGANEDGEEFGQDLRQLVGNLAEISEKINSGEGTLGALVNDRSLYDGMEDVVVGVNDSKFARWLLRRYQRKGIENQGENAASPGTGSAEPAPQP